MPRQRGVGGMAWDPPIDLDGDRRPVRVSATDVASNSHCGRYLALKTHNRIRRVDGWERLFPPRDEPQIFPLGDVITLVMAAHQAVGLDSYGDCSGGRPRVVIG